MLRTYPKYPIYSVTSRFNEVWRDDSATETVFVAACASKVEADALVALLVAQKRQAFAEGRDVTPPTRMADRFPVGRASSSSWSRYLALGMSRHESFTAERAEDFAAGFARGATYHEREQLARQEARR